MYIYTTREYISLLCSPMCTLKFYFPANHKTELQPLAFTLRYDKIVLIIFTKNCKIFFIVQVERQPPQMVTTYNTIPFCFLRHCELQKEVVSLTKIHYNIFLISSLQNLVNSSIQQQVNFYPKTKRKYDFITHVNFKILVKQE